MKSCKYCIKWLSNPAYNEGLSLDGVCLDASSKQSTKNHDLGVTVDEVAGDLVGGVGDDYMDHGDQEVGELNDVTSAGQNSD